MSAAYQFKRCGQVHNGIPAFHADRPDQYWNVPEDKRDTDVFLTSDSCVIAGRFFFIRGCIDIPIIGTGQNFTWGVWVSLKEENFFLWQDHYESASRSHVGPFFGWLSTRLPVYPETLHLKTMAHLRDHGIRPFIEVERSEHPLSVEQHEGMTVDRAMDIVHSIESNDKPGRSLQSP